VHNLLFLIDSRGIHGKIVAGWGFREQIEEIVLANDAAAASEWEREAYVSAAGLEYSARVLSLADAVHQLPDLTVLRRTLLIVGSVADALEMLDRGLDHREIIISNLDPSRERQQLCPGVFVAESDRHTLNAIVERGVQVVVRLMPQDKPQPVQELL